jgi:predicted regulator of Ras-like GTPase activity (Roadblock/LC7/MglB family)
MGLSIRPPQARAIDRVLSDLLQKCPAQIIVLVEMSGGLISTLGEKGTIDLLALGALIAGDMAASQEMARITDQSEHSQLILREGSKTNTILSEAGPQMALYVKISKNAPIGWARLLIQEASRQLADIVSTNPDDPGKLDLGVDEGELNHLIGDGLDSIWNE